MKLAFLFLLILIAGCTVNIDNFNNTINDSNILIEQNNTNLGNNTVIDKINNTNASNNIVIQQNNSLDLTTWYDEGVLIDLPVNWSVVFYGSCATKSFIAYDINNPIRQVFYFSEAGPVYISQSQKTNDLEWKAYYENLGANYAIYWTDAPVVAPLTAESFLFNFKSLAESYVMRTVAPLAPKIYDIQVISSKEPSAKILTSSTDAQTIRALFKQNNSLGEGLFYIETAEMPIAGIGYGMTFIGLSAGEDEFLKYEETLNNILKSYTISEEYVYACVQAQNTASSAALKAGQALSDTSDNIMDSWNNRQRSDDILSEKWSDTTLSYERVYDSETGEVYRVENGFYDSYNINRQHYEMNNLEQLPDNDWELWTASTNPQNMIK